MKPTNRAVSNIMGKKYLMNWVKGTIFTIVDWTLTFVRPGHDNILFIRRDRRFHYPELQYGRAPQKG